MPGLLAIADDVTKIHAICTVCGAPAHRSQRVIASKEQVVLGETDSYEARCRGHYEAEEDLADLPLKEEMSPILEN
jgi:thymidine kinase